MDIFMYVSFIEDMFIDSDNFTPVIKFLTRLNKFNLKMFWDDVCCKNL